MENLSESTKGNNANTLLATGFNVATYSILNKDVTWCHWAEGLKMIISKNGINIVLDSEEIQQIVKSLPKTFGGKY